MRIDDIDPDELDDAPRRGRRRWVIGGSIVAVAAVAVGLAMVGGSGGDGSSSATDPSAQEIDDTVPGDPGDIMPMPMPVQDGFPDMTSDWCCDELEQLYARTTDAGIRLVVQNSGDWGGVIWDKPMPIEPAVVPATTAEATVGGEGDIAAGASAAGEATPAAPPDVVGADGADPAGGVTPTLGGGSGGSSGADADLPAVIVAPVPFPNPFPAGWEPPAWCNAVGGFRVTMTYKDAVGSSQGQRYAEPRDGINVTLFSSGFAEGTPFRVLVMQVAPDVTSAAVRFSDGGVDAAAPAGGWVALGVPGPRSGKFSVTLKDGAGERTIDWQDLPQVGDAAWQAGCTPPPPGLPEPGEPPADPGAAEAEVRDAFDALWDDTVPIDERVKAFVDDPTGVADAMELVAEGGLGDIAASATHELTDLVFTSPTEAWFQYDLLGPSFGFTGRFGTARLVGGRWLISRAVVCQDLAIAGVACEPWVDPVSPPGFEPTRPWVRGGPTMPVDDLAVADTDA